MLFDFNVNCIEIAELHDTICFQNHWSNKNIHVSTQINVYKIGFTWLAKRINIIFHYKQEYYILDFLDFTVILLAETFRFIVNL